MVALAHVEASSVGQVAEIGEIDFVLGAYVTAAERGLLERDAILMAFSDIEKGAAIGTEQPFVGRKGHEIRIEARHVERQYAGALRRVDQEARAVPPQRVAHPVEIDHAAVRPVYRRDRGEADRRRA